MTEKEIKHMSNMQIDLDCQLKIMWQEHPNGWIL